MRFGDDTTDDRFQFVAFLRFRCFSSRAVSSLQNTRFKLAECATQIQMAQLFVDRCMSLLLANRLDAATAAMAKYAATEIEVGWLIDCFVCLNFRDQGKVLDELLQLHGGYGLMSAYPISQGDHFQKATNAKQKTTNTPSTAFVDARVTRIYGGTNEIMKEVIGRSLGLNDGDHKK